MQLSGDPGAAHAVGEKAARVTGQRCMRTGSGPPLPIEAGSYESAPGMVCRRLQSSNWTGTWKRRCRLRRRRASPGSDKEHQVACRDPAPALEANGSTRGSHFHIHAPDPDAGPWPLSHFFDLPAAALAFFCAFALPSVCWPSTRSSDSCHPSRQSFLKNLPITPILAHPLPSSHRLAGDSAYTRRDNRPLQFESPGTYSLRRPRLYAWSRRE
jgi:hypothetical protein